MPTNEHISSNVSPYYTGQQDQEEQIKTDFDQFYDNNLQPFLAQLTREAQAYKNWKYFTIGSGILGVVFFALYQFIHLESGLNIGGLLLLIAVLGIYYTTQKSEKFIDDFKDKIISRILHHISSGAVYKPMQYLSKKDYIASGLYRRRFTEYSGEDYWKAIYKSVSFYCSELLVRYEDAAVATTIFKGLFTEAVINNYYSGGTYIWTKGASQIPASMADANYRMYPLPGIQKYPVANELFNESFSVYSNNFSQTAALLTPARLQKIMLLKKKINRDIVFSFASGKCFVAIPMEEDLLEPSVKNLHDKESYKKFFFTFLLVFNIISELELDQLQ